jgi:hypothetical protein
VSEKGEEGDRWRRGVEHGELFGLKEGVERFGVFMGSTREGFPRGVSLRPSGSRDF